MKYQHIRWKKTTGFDPLPDLDSGHTATPDPRKALLICVTCGEEIIPVEESEGPESLKSLLQVGKGRRR